MLKIDDVYFQDALVGLVSSNRHHIADCRIETNQAVPIAKVSIELLIKDGELLQLGFPHKFQPTRVKENAHEDSD